MRAQIWDVNITLAITINKNCKFCYCPFYPCVEGSTGGKWIKDKGVWSCEDCEWIHNDDTVECIQTKLPNITP